MEETNDMKVHELHDPDLSTSAWEKRWDGQKEVKKAARENSVKLKDDMQNEKTSKVVEKLTKKGNAAQNLRKKRGRAQKSDGEISDDEPVNSKVSLKNLKKKYF